MCNPMLAIAAATSVLSIGSSIVERAGAKQAYNANVTAANLNYAQQQNVINQKASQIDQNASERVFDSAITRQQAEGRIAASATSQGLAPTSIIQALNADMFGIGRQDAVATANDNNSRAQLINEQQGAIIERQSQINRVAKPSGLSLALGIGKGVLAGANAYHSLGGKF